MFIRVLYVEVCEHDRCASVAARSTVGMGRDCRSNYACRWLNWSRKRGLTRYLLAGEPERLRHSEGVARRAEFLTPAVDRDQAPLLVAAAWMHDIGYAPSLRDSGFHPLDGARYLRSAGWPRVICDLVAHHSGSRFVAAALGMSEELGDFGYQENRLTDALTVADQTCGPNGRPMTVEERFEDMLARHGPHSPMLAPPSAGTIHSGAARRVTTRLEASGIDAADLGIF